MTTLREAAQMALEAMESVNYANYSWACIEAITALRDALADGDNVAPTEPPQRKPLTDEQIMAIGKELGLKCRLGGNANIDFDYARAIERAHGIGGNE